MLEVDVEETLLSLQALTKKSWFWKVLLYLPLVALVAYVLYRFDQDGKELARLHSEVEILQIRKENAENAAKAETAKGKQAMLGLEAKILGQKIETLDASLKKEQERHEERKKTIDRLRTWDALDAEWDRRSGTPSDPVKPAQPSSVDPWPDDPAPKGKPN